MSSVRDNRFVILNAPVLTKDSSCFSFINTYVLQILKKISFNGFVLRIL
jgi:hypothetical protein